MNEWKYEPEEVDDMLYVMLDNIKQCRALEPPMSLWLLEVADRPQMLFNFANLIRGEYRSPQGWPPPKDPLYDALADSSKRVDYLRHASGNVELLIQAFEMVDVYDAAIHAPERWPDFDKRFGDFEHAILSRLKENESE